MVNVEDHYELSTHSSGAYEVQIEIFKGVRTFGLALEGGANNERSPGDNSIYVAKVLEGGLAELDGRIKAGDQIVAIKQYLDDGDAYTFSLDGDSNVTHEGAKQLLRRCKGRIAIFISRKTKPPFENNNEALTTCSQKMNGNSDKKIDTETNKPVRSSSLKLKKSVDSLSSISCPDLNMHPSHAAMNAKTNSRAARRTLSFNSYSYRNGLYTAYNSRGKMLKVVSIKCAEDSDTPVVNSTNTAGTFDYRELAKYGIRPNASLSANVVKSHSNVPEVHRVKTNWRNVDLSNLAITEEEEDPLQTAHLRALQTDSPNKQEQRVL